MEKVNPFTNGHKKTLTKNSQGSINMAADPVPSNAMDTLQSQWLSGWCRTIVRRGGLPSQFGMGKGKPLYKWAQKNPD
jgi:hypothetical protein